MGRADRAAIDAGTPGRVLMERAGRAVAREAIRIAGGRYGRRAVVVCGTGNNGGDGFVAARHLRRAGMGVTCLVVGDLDKIRGDARLHLDAMTNESIVERRFDERSLRGAAVVIDALFGTGFKGAPRDDAARAIAAMNASGAPVVAVDIPSGVDGATGAVEGDAVRASVTVAMAAEKIGSALPPGALHAGTVIVAEIGIPVAATVHMVEEDDVAAAMRPRAPDAHKRTTGSVVVIAGSEEIRGAPLLTARGALRAGAGYVTLGSTAAVRAAAAAALPEALSVLAGDRVLGPDALDALVDALRRADAVALGPGLGTGPEQEKLVRRALEEIDVPIVLDADALNVLSASADVLAARRAPTVLTPHPGELARLLGRSTGDAASDRLGAAREAAGRFPGAVVLAKGHRTIVAWKGGDAAAVVPRGGPELATAGTGDVLTGLIAALLAAGCEPAAAAWAGAWLHGDAGAAAASRRGPSGVSAGDVADSLGIARTAAGARRLR